MSWKDYLVADIQLGGLSVEALFTIVGIILGFFLNEWSQRRRERASERKQAEAVRVLLRHEATTNLKRLADLWHRIMQGQLTARADISVGRLVELPFTGFTEGVWKSQLPLIPAALKPVELDAITSFYERLRALEALRNRLIAARQYPDDFRKLTPELWERCQQLEVDLRGGGNPLERVNPGSVVSRAT